MKTRGLKGFCIGIAALLLCGCTTPITEHRWVQDGKTEAETERAMAECKFEAKKVTNPQSPFKEAYDQVELFRACMKAKGYREAD